MLALSIAVLFAFQSRDTTKVAIPSDSYADAATADLVTRARAARERNERLVTSYTAIAKQRIGVGIRALSRDRMLYRNETVARIKWNRDSASSVEVIGAREGIPVVKRGDQLPEDLDFGVRDLVINPAEDVLRFIGGDDDEGFIYTLRKGGEQDYKFALGDTTTITLQNGKRIQLLALKIIPRRADWKLMSGTLWYDQETLGLVRAVFKPARPFELQRDLSAEDKEDVPKWVNVTAEVKFLTLEYGLYESRWWMPRYMALDASGSMGSWLNVPIRFERVYEDYEVEGGTPPDPESKFIPAGTLRRYTDRDFRDTTITDPALHKAQVDSANKAMRSCIDSVSKRMDKVEEEEENRPGNTPQSRREKRIEMRREMRHCWRSDEDSTLAVIIPKDTMGILNSPELGQPILQMGDLISEDEIRGLGDAIGKLPAPPWDPRAQLPDGAMSILKHARYNRVEALSLGADATLDLGPAQLKGNARIGIADWVPNAELTLVRTAPTLRFGVTGYRRLAAANPDTRPFGAINSSMALLAQRDDGQYFRTLGVEGFIENPNSGWWTLRAYHEKQTAAEVETQASLPHLFNNENTFQPNIIADTAIQTGAQLTLRGHKALSYTLALGGETTVEGAFGDFDFQKYSATARFYVTPAGPLAGGLTVSAGTSGGIVPIQSAFFLGGPATLRGYDGGVMAGSAYWLGRAEIGNSFPAFRLTAFSDIGWAGDRSLFSTGKAKIGAGLGGSIMDGLIRMDISHGFSKPTGWRFDFYFDGIL
ncbi:MAG TPA: BamA/TamA family outer membrane protein [Gemmatimonadales bacterium]|nr:BamA/TamA family outer membrane protein [Gemmatimonadales bacterium]